VSRPRTTAIALFCLAAATIPQIAARDIEFRVVDDTGKPIPDAVVWFTPLDSAPPLAPHPEPIEIEQRHEEFIPFVSVIRTGSAVRLPNRDTVDHHVYSKAAAKSFDFPLYAPKMSETVVFDKPGIVPLGCNIHDWMIAYVVVVDTPWFAKTAADGTAVLKGMPGGKYRMEVWHHRHPKPTEEEIILTSDDRPQSLRVKLPLKADQRIPRPVGGLRKGYN
jgi:plastocyanin